MSIFEELKRRNVVRMAVLYAVGSWLILQIADVLFENLAVPEGAFRLVFALLLIGFPCALIFSWIYELTPEGIKREREVDRTRSITGETGRKLNITIVVLLVLAIGGLIADRLLPERMVLESTTTDAPVPTPGAEAANKPAPVVDDRSVAVLPFVNMSGDPENEYFSDGLSEELLNALAGIRQLKVTGRTSSFAFKGQNVDLREVGEALGVAHVLEGSVRKAENRVRITAQLIKTDEGYHLWSDAWDRELDDIFAIQQEIAERVSEVLRVTLLGEEAGTVSETRDANAYEAYLRGAHLLQNNPDDAELLERAEGYFEQALAADPIYLSAWYGMFQVWDRRNRNGIGAMDASIDRMGEIAGRLEQIDPTSMEVLLAQGRHSHLLLDWPRALANYAEARDRYPGNARTHFTYGGALATQNRIDEAMAAYQESLRLDPLELEALVRLTDLYVRTDDCDKARATAEQAIELKPGLGRVRGSVGYCHLIQGNDPAEALVWLDQEPLAFMSRTGKAIAFQRMGLQEQAEQMLAAMTEEFGDSASFQYSQIHAQWGQTDDAIRWLTRAWEVQDPGFMLACADRLLDPIRSDPRFVDVLRRAGLGACANDAPVAD